MKSSDIQNKIIELLSDNKEHSVQEMKSVLNSFSGDDYSEGQFAGSLNTLLRNGTISKSDRGVYTMKDCKVVKKCFVVSAIGDEESEIRKVSDQVYKYIIQPVCVETGFEAVRVDMLNKADTITETIIDHLINSELVIADITSNNPNAFYEMGYRSALRKPIIYLRSSEEKIPFDISSIRVFDYNLSDLDSVDKIKKRLQQTIEAMVFEEDNITPVKDNDINTSILPNIYELKDELNELKGLIQNQNSELLKTILSSLPFVQQEDPNTAIMKAIMPELIKNPESLKTLIDISNNSNHNKT